METERGIGGVLLECATELDLGPLALLVKGQDMRLNVWTRPPRGDVEVLGAAFTPAHVRGVIVQRVGVAGLDHAEGDVLAGRAAGELLNFKISLP